jgi:hypothetical protein
MIRTLYILTLVALMISCARGQSILGKHPADKVLPRFYQQNTNANTLVLGVNQSATVPFDLESPAFSAVKAAIGSGGSWQITNGPWLDTFGKPITSGTNTTIRTINGTNHVDVVPELVNLGPFGPGSTNLHITVSGGSLESANQTYSGPFTNEFMDGVYTANNGSVLTVSSSGLSAGIATVLGQIPYVGPGPHPSGGSPAWNWVQGDLSGLPNVPTSTTVSFTTNAAVIPPPVIVKVEDGSLKATYDIAVSNLYVNSFVGDGGGLTNVNASVLNFKRESELYVARSESLLYYGSYVSGDAFAAAVDLEYYAGQIGKLANNQVEITSQPTPRSSYATAQYPVWFNQPEVIIDQEAAGPLYLEFTNYVNAPEYGNIADYCTYNVVGTNIHVRWPRHWSPSTTNEYHFTNNGLVSFKILGTNVFAAGYHP